MTCRSPLLPAMARTQLATHRSSPRCRHWSREVELRPARPSLDVGTAPAPLEQVEVEERPAAHVENGGLLLDDPAPRAHLGDHVSKVVEQLERAMRHGTVRGRSPRSGAGGAVRTAGGAPRLV